VRRVSSSFVASFIASFVDPFSLPVVADKAPDKGGWGYLGVAVYTLLVCLAGY
jgi:hypothetical protein